MEQNDRAVVAKQQQHTSTAHPTSITAVATARHTGTTEAKPATTGGEDGEEGEEAAELEQQPQQQRR